MIFVTTFYERVCNLITDRIQAPSKIICHPKNPLSPARMGLQCRPVVQRSARAGVEMRSPRIAVTDVFAKPFRRAAYQVRTRAGPEFDGATSATSNFNLAREESFLNNPLLG